MGIKEQMKEFNENAVKVLEEENKELKDTVHNLEMIIGVAVVVMSKYPDLTKEMSMTAETLFKMGLTMHPNKKGIVKIAGAVIQGLMTGEL